MIYTPYWGSNLQQNGNGQGSHFSAPLYLIFDIIKIMGTILIDFNALVFVFQNFYIFILLKNDLVKFYFYEFNL